LIKDDRHINQTPANISNIIIWSNQAAILTQQQIRCSWLGAAADAVVGAAEKRSVRLKLRLLRHLGPMLIQCRQITTAMVKLSTARFGANIKSCICAASAGYPFQHTARAYSKA
jgi:hypothetical protein